MDSDRYRADTRNVCEAFRVANSPRKGPVQLNLPRDVLSGSCDFGTLQQSQQCRPLSMPPANREVISEAAQKLCAATRPVIIAGGGIKNTNGAADTLALAETLHIPIVTSPGHGDAIPFSHPLNAGQMGPRGNMVASRLVKEADVILALGTRLGFNSTFYTYDHINRTADIIHVELEPTAIGRYFPVDIGIWGDAPSVARKLTEAAVLLQNRKLAAEWTESFKKERLEFLARRDQETDIATHPIQPSGLFKTLREVLPKACALTMDAGTLCLQATDAMNYWQAKSLFTPLDFGLVGFSYACGMGVKLAMPDRPVVSLMGDGGFGMTVSELSTAVDPKALYSFRRDSFKHRGG